MGSKLPSQTPSPGCDKPQLERNRYYTGKFMTARDFQGEQDYHRSRFQLHNRLMHGWGIVCGLEVVANPNKECRSTTVVVKAGVGLDCCGREVVLLEDAVFEVPRPAAVENAATLQPAEQKTEGIVPRESLLLCLYYGEDPIEMTPSLYADAGCGTESQQANRIREVASLRTVHLYEVEESCWVGGKQPTPCRDDCDDQIPGPAGAFLQAECPCGAGIPLALLSFQLDGQLDPIEIDIAGRRRLPVSSDLLTHVAKTNWHHGQTMKVSHLRDHLHGRLEIRFDRKIRQATENLGLGISEFTFIVQFGGVQDDVRYLPYDPERPPFLEEECIAVFQIDPEILESKHHDDLRDKVIYISLKCDFIPDCRGIPVDGSFLNGTYSMHSGRMGGLFESWFVIAPSEGETRERSEVLREIGAKRPRPRRGDAS